MRKLTMDELNRISKAEFEQAEKTPIILILDNIRSLSNVGAFFRTADAFRIKELVLCGITACPPHREIHKTALGAEESVDWVYFGSTEEAVRSLRAEGYRIFSVEQVHHSIALPDLERDDLGNGPVAVVLGHEVFGVSQAIVDMSDGCIEIPQQGTKHSLNVSVAAGIVLYSVSQLLSERNQTRETTTP